MKVFRSGTDLEILENEKRNKSRQKTIESLTKDPSFKGKKHLLGAGSSPERDEFQSNNYTANFEKRKNKAPKKMLMPRKSNSSENLMNVSDALIKEGRQNSVVNKGNNGGLLGTKNFLDDDPYIYGSDDVMSDDFTFLNNMAPGGQQIMTQFFFTLT